MNLYEFLDESDVWASRFMDFTAPFVPWVLGAGLVACLVGFVARLIYNSQMFRSVSIFHKDGAK